MQKQINLSQAAQGVLSSYDEAREKNVEEWNSYEDQLKEDISSYNQKMLLHSMKVDKLQTEQESLVSKAELYN